MKWQASPETDEDLIAARNFIAYDNEQAARDFLDAAFEAFDRLAQFPEMGPRARFKARALKGVRFLVMPPPFNGWLIFYEPQNTASAGFHSDTNLNTIFNLVPGKVVSVALSSSAILVAN